MTTKISYNMAEAVAATGLSEKKIKRAIAAGELAAHKSGEVGDDGKARGVYVIKAKALEAWVDGMAVA